MVAAQDMIGFLSCESTLLSHVHLAIHKYPQILLSRAVLYSYLSQLVVVSMTEVQDITLGLVDHMRFTWVNCLKLYLFEWHPIPQLC